MALETFHASMKVFVQKHNMTPGEYLKMRIQQHELVLVNGDMTEATLKLVRTTLALLKVVYTFPPENICEYVFSNSEWL